MQSIKKEQLQLAASPRSCTPPEPLPGTGANHLALFLITQIYAGPDLPLAVDDKRL